MGLEERAALGGMAMRREVLFLALLAASCRCPRDAPPPEARAPARPAAPAAPRVAPPDAAADPTPDAASDAQPDAPPRLAPLAAEQALVPLDVEGFREAVVSVPLGATEPRPVMVALHGNFDRPGWQCQVWREIVGNHPFILCPRGVPRGDAPKSLDRWTYAGLHKTEQELLSGLEALEARWPEHADDGPVLFTGFSLGAILGVHILKKHPERFPRAVLTEGGNKGWSYAAAGAYRKGGGQRVLFACAQVGCVQLAKAAKRVLEKKELLVEIADGGNVGHTYDGPVADAIAGKLQWLFEGDPRWQLK